MLYYTECKPPRRGEFPPFENGHEGCKVLYSISTYGGKVQVVGDGDNGWYEFVIRNEEGLITEFSEAGYGCVGVAMRDGLIVAEGTFASGDELLRDFLAASRVKTI